MKSRRSWWVIPLYGVAALVLTWPLLAAFGSRLPAVYGATDPILQLFFIGWGWQALTSHPLGVMNAPIFYPEPHTLTYSDHLLGEAVMAGPVTSIFGVGAGYNTLVILSFILSGWGLYRLARLLGVSRPASCLAGFLFAFCPYRFSNLGELNQLQTQFLPLGLFFAFRFLRTGRFRYGAGVTLALVAQAYFGWYSTFHLLIALLLLLAWTIFRDRGPGRIPWGKTAILALGGAALMLPGTLPYLIQHRAMPEFHRSLGQSALWSADLLNYLQLPPENLLARLRPALADDHGYFPGLVAVVLAGIALRRRPRGAGTGAATLSPGPGGRWNWRRWVDALRRGGATAYFVLLGAGALILSLGPILHVAGRRIWIPLPYAVCYYVIPGFSSMRVPGRFAVLVALAAAVLAGLGFDRLRRRHPRRRGSLLLAGLGTAAILAWSPTLPFVAVPPHDPMPPVYTWLRDRPGKEPILELPAPPSEPEESLRDVQRQFYVLYHGKPRLDGTSGFTSRRYQAFRRTIQTFPDPDALRAARDLGAKLVIVHYGDYAPAEGNRLRARVAATASLRRLATFGEDVVYALEPPEGAAPPEGPAAGG